VQHLKRHDLPRCTTLQFCVILKIAPTNLRLNNKVGFSVSVCVPYIKDHGGKTMIYLPSKRKCDPILIHKYLTNFDSKQMHNPEICLVDEVAQEEYDGWTPVVFSFLAMTTRDGADRTTMFIAKMDTKMDASGSFVRAGMPPIACEINASTYTRLLDAFDKDDCDACLDVIDDKETFCAHAHFVAGNDLPASTGEEGLRNFFRRLCVSLYALNRPARWDEPCGHDDPPEYTEAQEALLEEKELDLDRREAENRNSLRECLKRLAATDDGLARRTLAEKPTTTRRL
jgi:hypothetical protein